ncbi:DNA-binding response regulator [Sphaerisporangium siamense]|nr:DNA-binding response regulator [Sphaerisporangium siamense]
MLVVEDDLRMANALTAALRRFGNQVMHAPTCQDAGKASGYDLMLLDLCLPDGDGIAFCRLIRECSSVPIIMLSARGAEQDRILGLRAGADDYLVKPFSMVELEARMQAVMRRPRTLMNSTIRIADITLDLTSRTADRAGRTLSLTPKEFGLLARLAGNEGRVVGREQLLREIWQDTGKAAARTLDVHITNLRAKLGRPPVLETVRGVGYRITLPETI